MVISSLWMVLFFFFFSTILRFVFLNGFVINVVSLPMGVKETGLCVVLSVCVSDVVVGCLWVGVLCMRVGEETVVLHNGVDSVDFFIVFFLCRWYVLSLLYRNLIAAYLCWA